MEPLLTFPVDISEVTDTPKKFPNGQTMWYELQSDGGIAYHVQMNFSLPMHPPKGEDGQNPA